MQIEPEALYTLFETLIVPKENNTGEPEIQVNLEPTKSVTLVFKDRPGKEDLVFLEKILAAVKVGEDETSRLYNVSPEICMEILESADAKVITWGFDLPGVEKYKTTEFQKSVVIVSDDLTSLQKDQTLKMKLWNCLKATFIQN